MPPKKSKGSRTKNQPKKSGPVAGSANAAKGSSKGGKTSKRGPNKKK